MKLTKKLEISGEHSLTIPGPIGDLETVLTAPESIKSESVAVLGHPHSLQGGTMNNKVVTTLARTFKELGIPSLRFNFRGVGQTTGVYDAGIGESEDMLFLARQWQQEKPTANLIFAGFSFGSYVAYRTAAQLQHALLITVAPPVHHYDYTEFEPSPSPWVVVQGEKDEVVPFSLVLDFAAQRKPPLSVLRFADTSHFFHGKLTELKSQLLPVITAQVKMR